MTKRERKERKLQRRLDWADKRDKKSDEEREAGEKMADCIPFGQPILLGHHSEKRHRNHIKKIQNHSTKAVENSKMADHHREKADNLEQQLKTTIFSDDVDAVERLQDKIDALGKKRDRLKEIKKALKKGIDIELTASEKKHLEGNKRCWSDYNIMPYELTNLGATIRNAKKRIEKILAKKEMKKKRYITLLSITEEQKLNHGKSWKCTGKNINDHDLPGEYEGQLICYVY